MSKGFWCLTGAKMSATLCWAKTSFGSIVLVVAGVLLLPELAAGQLVDNTKATNNLNAGINKSLAQEIGAGRGNLLTPDSSVFIIDRDPFRAIRRGRQIFQRKFTRVEGQGPNNSDGTGDINTNLAIGAGLVDSCGGCHSRPRGSAGNGGNVVTRPDSRDAPHLFGLGLKEMLADEITSDLRAIRLAAITEAKSKGRAVTKKLQSKGISYGSITAYPSGSVDTSAVEGVDPDLRVRPFFAQGGEFSMRAFAVGAFKNEMGLEAADPDLLAANQGQRVVTPSGLVLDGSLDKIDAPPAPNASADPDGDRVVDEVPTSLIDFMEFYLLNYFKAGTYRQTEVTADGRKLFVNVGCATCHIPDLKIEHDRRVADVETVYDPVHGIFNNLFATATGLFYTVNDGSGYPDLKLPLMKSFVVRNFFSDLKRHDVGPGFHERNYDGTLQTQFLTTPLWGVGSTEPFGHDGRSMNLTEVILRHGGEAQDARDEFAQLDDDERQKILAFLNSLVLFPPDDTASNLDPGNRSAPNFPQFGHGGIKLTVLFNNPKDVE